MQVKRDIKADVKRGCWRRFPQGCLIPYVRSWLLPETAADALSRKKSMAVLHRLSVVDELGDAMEEELSSVVASVSAELM